MKEIDVGKLQRQIAYWLDYHEVDDAGLVLVKFTDAEKWYYGEELDLPETAITVLNLEGLNSYELFNHYGTGSVGLENKLVAFLDSLGVRLEIERHWTVTFHETSNG
jgi:hypothetical protein